MGGCGAWRGGEGLRRVARFLRAALLAALARGPLARGVGPRDPTAGLGANLGYSSSPMGSRGLLGRSGRAGDQSEASQVKGLGRGSAAEMLVVYEATRSVGVRGRSSSFGNAVVSGAAPRVELAAAVLGLRLRRLGLRVCPRWWQLCMRLQSLNLSQLPEP